jgi:hypothetical protein
MARSIIAENLAKRNPLHLKNRLRDAYKAIHYKETTTGYCFADMPYLAETFGVSLSQAYRIVNQLEAFGVVEVVRESGQRTLLKTISAADDENAKNMRKSCEGNAKEKPSSQGRAYTHPRKDSNTQSLNPKSSVCEKKTNTVEHPKRNGVQASPKDTKPPHSILSQEGKIPPYPYDTVQGSPRTDARDVSTAPVQSASCEAGETIERGCAKREECGENARTATDIRADMPLYGDQAPTQRVEGVSTRQYENGLDTPCADRPLVGTDILSHAPAGIEAHQADTDTLTEERTYHGKINVCAIRGDSTGGGRTGMPSPIGEGVLPARRGRGGFTTASNPGTIGGKQAPVGDNETAVDDFGATADSNHQSLIANGVSPAMASRIAERFDAHAIQCAIRYARQQQARGRCRDVTAFLVASLLKGWSMPLMDCTPESIEAQHRKAREAAYVPRIAEKREPAVIQGDMPPMALLRAKYHEGCAKAAGGGIGV